MRPPAAPQTGGWRWLWALCLLCVAVTLTLHRPDADDPFYLHLAVAAVDQPEAPLIAADTLHGIPGVPLPMPIYKVQALELLQAALAFLTPLRVLDVAHILFPALAAVLLVLAQARLIRLLAPGRWLWGTAMLVAVLLCIGEPHRSYGNFAFVRLYQGKAILLSVMLPLVAATALEFALAPGWRRFWRLAAAQIAAVGISATALWAAPITAGLALAAATDLRWRAIRNLLWGLAASAYVLALGLLLHGESAGLIQRGEEFWQEYGTAAFAMERVLGSGLQVYVFLFALIASWSLASSDLLRRFCVVFALGFLLLFWNPFTDTWVAKLLTSEPVYWRVFWLVPLPLLLALALTAPLDFFTSRWIRWSASLIPAAIVLLWTPAIATWAPENDVHFGWPQWKLPPVEGEAARTMVRSTDAGDFVLAPERDRALDPDFPPPPEASRDPLQLPVPAARDPPGGGDPATRRPRELVSGTQRQLGAEELLRTAITDYPLAAVCLSGHAMDWPELQRALERSPLELVVRKPTYEVWARPQPGAVETS